MSKITVTFTDSRFEDLTPELICELLLDHEFVSGTFRLERDQVVEFTVDGVSVNLKEEAARPLHRIRSVA